MIFHIEINYNDEYDYHSNNDKHLSDKIQSELAIRLFNQLLPGDKSIKIEVEWVAKDLFIIRADKTDLYETENSNLYFSKIKYEDFKLLDVFNFLIDKVEDLNIQSKDVSQAMKKFKRLNDE